MSHMLDSNTVQSAHVVDEMKRVSNVIAFACLSIQMEI